MLQITHHQVFKPPAPMFDTLAPRPQKIDSFFFIYLFIYFFASPCNVSKFVKRLFERHVLLIDCKFDVEKVGLSKQSFMKVC